MSLMTFPPSSNWYLSNATASDGDYRFAYVSRQHVVILTYDPDLAAQPRTIPYLPQVQVLYYTHEGRANCVCFEPGGSNECRIVTGGEDGLVRVWGSDNKEVVACSAHKTSVYCLDWSQFNPNYVASGDDGGTIVWWNLRKNAHKLFRFPKEAINCIQCSPHRQHWLAFGCQKGLVYIMNVDTGDVIHRMRGHNQDVQSVTWCPVTRDVFRPEETEPAEPVPEARQPLLLATVGRDKQIRVWSATQGRTLLIIDLPISKLKTTTEKKHATMFFGLVWKEPEFLYSSGIDGELLRWDLFKMRNEPKQGCNTMHREHARGLFNLSGTTHWVWSAAQDRSIVIWDTKSAKVVCKIPTIGGFVYDLMPSPIDPSRIAVGVGDNIIRVWNMASKDIADVASIWQGIKGKVTVLAWHPWRESWLAFGTEEGRVGIHDVLACNNKPPIIFQAHHSRMVYALTWAPKFPYKKDEGNQKPNMLLYTCCGKKGFIFDPSQPQKNAASLDCQLREANPEMPMLHVSELIWNSELNVLAVGTELGVVDMYDCRTLRLMCTLAAHHKVIQGVKWHPQHLSSSEQPSQYVHWVAVASKDSVIKVYDLSAHFGGGDTEKLVTRSTVTLEGHLNQIARIQWSPHVEGQLLSVSYDASAQVWDAIKGKPLANFQGHDGRLFCGIWSPLDPDLVITGGDDFLINVWRVSEQKRTLPDPKKKKLTQKEKDGKFTGKKKFHALKAVNGEKKGDVSSGVTQTQGKPSEDCQEIPNEKHPDVQSDPREKRPGQSYTKIGVMSYEAKNRYLKKRSLFPTCSTLDCRGRAVVQEAMYRLLEDEGKGNIGTGELMNLGFFSKDHGDLARTLDGEMQAHKDHDVWEQYVQVGAFKGDLKQAIETANKAGHLEEWMVTLAPSVSRKFWMEMCESYAHQLEEEGEHVKASMYKLAAGKVESAARGLVEKGMCREAVAMARNWLPEGDPLIGELYRKYIHHAQLTGQSEIGVKCHIALGQLREAYLLLMKVGDNSSLKLASVLAQKAGSPQEAIAIAFLCFTNCLQKLDFEMARSLKVHHPEILCCDPLILVHEKLTRRMTTLPRPIPGADYGCLEPDGKPWLEVVKTELQEFNVDEEEMVNLLAKVVPTPGRGAQTSLAAKLIQASKEICQGLLSKSRDCTDDEVVVKAICCCEDTPLFTSICRILLPFRPSDDVQAKQLYTQGLASWLGTVWPNATDPPEESGSEDCDFDAIRNAIPDCTDLVCKTSVLQLVTLASGIDAAEDLPKKLGQLCAAMEASELILPECKEWIAKLRKSTVRPTRITGESEDALGGVGGGAASIE